jgi:hypothetical protein
MQIDGRRSFQVILFVIAALLTATSAAALPSQEVSTMVRHASEPTTGTMVVAALLVVATARMTTSTFLFHVPHPLTS